jgi:hypothetical protein
VATAKTACLTTVRHGELSHGRRELFCSTPIAGSGSMASSRTGRCLSYSLRVVQWRRNDRCTARELVNRKDGRLPDDADLVVRALALLEGFAAYPVGAPPHRRTSAGCEVLRLKSPLPYAPRATGDMGRASGPTGQRQATAEAVQRAASGMPQRPAAPARRRPRAAACRAIGRSPTKSDLVGCSFKCSPNATALRSSIHPEIGISI